MVDNLMGPHLTATGKRRWCDKSLANATHLELLAELWPTGRFVLLHRHALDVVASSLEAAIWGLDQYGFATYAQMSPTNPVIALVGYWIERTGALLRFEERHPDRCLRIRYEDLVGGPTGSSRRSGRSSRRRRPPTASPPPSPKPTIRRRPPTTRSGTPGPSIGTRSDPEHGSA